MKTPLLFATLMGFGLLSGSDAFAYGCRAKVDEQVTCVLRSKNVFAAIDHGSLSISHTIAEQDPGSERPCKQIGVEDFGASLELNLKGDTNSYGSRAHSSKIIRNEATKTLRVQELIASSGIVFLGLDASLGIARGISGSFSFEKPTEQDIKVAIDGADLELVAACVPKAVGVMDAVNRCLDQLVDKRDLRQSCAKAVYESVRGD